jgi:septal ring factor EnvC (AmiA/AmiB activator)
MLRRAAAALLVVVLASTPALGARVERGSVERLESQARDQQRRRDALRADARAAAREVETLRAELIRLARAQSGDEREVMVQRARLDAMNVREAALTARMSDNRRKLTRLLAALQLYSRNPPPALLVSPESANDAVRAAILMRAVTPELERRALALRREAEEIARLRREAALAGETLFTVESETADRRTRIERLLAEKSRLEARLYAEASSADAESRALAAQASDLRGLVAGLSRRAAPESTNRSAAAAGPRTAPVEGEIVRRFGGESEGVAFRPVAGAQVVAPASSVVEYAGPLRDFGQVVVLRASDGSRIVLAGLSAVSARAGRSIYGGEPVGRMADRAEPAPELYMEVRRGDRPIDPGRWLDAGRQP